MTGTISCAPRRFVAAWANTGQAEARVHRRGHTGRSSITDIVSRDFRDTEKMLISQRVSDYVFKLVFNSDIYSIYTYINNLCTQRAVCVCS